MAGENSPPAAIDVDLMTTEITEHAPASVDQVGRGAPTPDCSSFLIPCSSRNTTLQR
jgi:hypothetical protein